MTLDEAQDALDEPATRRTLTRWRHAYRLSQDDAARLLGVSLMTYWRWEQGERPATGHRLLYLAIKGATVDLDARATRAHKPRARR